jgi:hypothetical protein
MSFAAAYPTRGARESSWNRFGRQGTARDPDPRRRGAPYRRKQDPTRRSLRRPCRILVGSVPKSAGHGGHLSAASGLTLSSNCRLTGRRTPPELRWHALCVVCRLPRACSLSAGEAGSSVKIQNEVHMPRPKRRKAAKRELVAPRGDKRFVRRDDQGQFSESDDTGRSLRKDVKRRAKTRVASGQGDRGDRKKRSRKS